MILLNRLRSLSLSILVETLMNLPVLGETFISLRLLGEAFVTLRLLVEAFESMRLASCSASVFMSCLWQHNKDDWLVVGDDGHQEVGHQQSVFQ